MTDSGTEPPSPELRPRSPYVGLVPFGESEAAYFFGRRAETAIVSANLRASRLTILYGPSGVGKSSLLMAGVVPALRREQAAWSDDEGKFLVCAFRGWSADDPARALTDAIASAARSALGEIPPARSSLVETLGAWTPVTGTLLVVLDQFEEYFHYHPDDTGDEGLAGLAAELASVVNDPGLPVHVLVSIREDSWARLDVFEGAVPGLFDNYIRVEHLGRDAAAEAILGPVARWNEGLQAAERVEVKADLVEAILDSDEGLARRNDDDHGTGIAAPFLQLVLWSLWNDMKASGSRTLSAARLRELGGTRQIVEAAMLEQVGRLSSSEKTVAAACFRFLVPSAKRKYAQTVPVLAGWTKLPAMHIEGVLEKLCTRPGVLTRGEAGYELSHDILAEPVLEWWQAFERDRERREARRKALRAFLLGGSIVAVIVALGIWAFVQRHDARQTSAFAASFELATAAKGQLDRRPDTALLLGLAAYEAHATPAAVQSVSEALARVRQTGVARIVRASDAPLRAIAFDSRGRLATGADGGEITIWDTVTGRVIASTRTRRPRVNSIAFSPDGRSLAVASDDATLRLWRIASPDPSAFPGGHPGGEIQSVAFAPDGGLLVSGGSQGSVPLLRLSTGAFLDERHGLGEGPSGPVHDVAVSSTGTVAAANLRAVWLWKLARPPESPRRIAARSGAVVDWVAFSHDSTLLAGGGEDRRLHLWDVRSGRELRTRTEPADIRAVAFGPTGYTVAAALSDGTVRFWCARGCRGAAPLALSVGRVGAGRQIEDIAFSADGHILGAALSDGTAWLWHLPASVLGEPLTGKQGAATTALALAPNGAVLASRDGGGSILRWDPDGQPLPSLTVPGGVVHGLAVTPDGATVSAAIWAGRNGAVWLWNARGQPIGAPLTSDSHVDSVAFGDGGRDILAGTSDEKIRVWRRDGDQAGFTARTGYPVAVLAVAPDGRTVASGGKALTLWRLKDGSLQQLRRLPAESIGGLAFSSDGRTLAAASSNQGVSLWDVGSGRLLVSLPSGGSYSVAFSPDGRTLASGGDRLTLWDSSTLIPMLQLAAGDAPVKSVAFGAGGTTLASGGSRGRVRVWRGILWRSTADLRAQVCGLLLGGISHRQWQTLTVRPYRPPCRG